MYIIMITNENQNGLRDFVGPFESKTDTFVYLRQQGFVYNGRTWLFGKTEERTHGVAETRGWGGCCFAYKRFRHHVEIDAERIAEVITPKTPTFATAGMR